MSWTHEGIEISVTDSGQFRATVGAGSEAHEVTAASLFAAREAIHEALLAQNKAIEPVEVFAYYKQDRAPDYAGPAIFRGCHGRQGDYLLTVNGQKIRTVRAYLYRSDWPERERLILLVQERREVFDRLNKLDAELRELQEQAVNQRYERLNSTQDIIASTLRLVAALSNGKP